MDRIELMGMEFFGYHGCLDVERSLGQKFIVDAKLYFSLDRAGKSDALEDTVNYAAVFATIRSIVEGEPVKLIECLAERIAAELLAVYPLDAVGIAVHKPAAPIAGRFADVNVQIRRSRQK